MSMTTPTNLLRRNAPISLANTLSKALETTIARLLGASGAPPYEGNLIQWSPQRPIVKTLRPVSSTE